MSYKLPGSDPTAIHSGDVAGGALGGIFPNPSVTPASDLDTDAVHLTTSAEISGLALKAAPDDTDHLIIEDSVAGNAKKRVPFSAFSRIKTFDWSGASAIVTANAADAGGTVSDNIPAWFNLGLVHRLHVVAASNTTNITIEIYADAALTTVLYQAKLVDAFTSAFEDSIPWHYRDDDHASQLHYQITNNGVSASTFTITLQGLGE